MDQPAQQQGEETYRGSARLGGQGRSDHRPGQRRRPGRGMTYYEAALRVLKFVGRPLTAREITDQAIEAGLIAPAGKTPYATMSAALYMRVRSDLELLKMEDPGNGRAKHGSVRWMAVSRLQCQ